MERWLRQLSVGARLSYVLGAVFAVVFAAGVWALAHRTSRQLEGAVIEELAAKNQLVLNNLATYNAELERSALVLARTFAAEFPAGIAVEESALATVGTRRVPVVRSGDRQLALDTTSVDHFTAMTGAVATVFARTGEDLVRVSTSLKDEAGKRVLGTALDSSHPAHAALLQGRPFTGRARLFGREYMTRYEPVVSGGRTVAVLFVGEDFTDALAALVESLRSVKVGNTGYVFAMDASRGPARGTFTIHPYSQGRSRLETRDADGRAFLQDMLTTRSGVMRYPWRNAEAGELGAREKVAAYAPFEPWNWVIGSTAGVDELTVASRDVVRSLAAGGVVALALLAGIVHLASRRWVSRPLAGAVEVANQVAAGDLRVHLEVTGGDEIGRILAAMNGMAANLRQMIATTQGGAHEVASAASQILATTRRTVQGVQDQAAAIQETTATAAELQQTVRLTEERARDVQEAMQRTARSNDSIRAQLALAGEAIGRIHQEMETIVGSIQDLSRRNLQIGEIIESVGEVADQTQLLAINAGIEAAKAGDVGRGFSVVAAEMKALADQTKKASQHIRTIVGEVQRAAGATTRVVETGQARLKDAVRPVGDVVPLVEQLTTEVDASNQSLRQILAVVSQQVAGIEQITRAMRTVQDATQEGLSLNRDLEQGAESLNRLGERLRELVAAYRT